MTGNISLSDNSGNSMYQWAMATIQGEVYAVNQSAAPIWTQVRCFNFTADTNQNITLAELEGSLGMGATDVDGVNETFNLSFTGSFQVGTSITISSTSGCKRVALNVDDAYQESDFDVVILHDNTSNEAVIYTTVLEQDADNFKTGTETADFQLIVGENGQVATPTSYYFYVELA